MGHRFNRPNEAPPAWLPILLQRQPACMDARQWSICLDGYRAEAMSDRELRRSLDALVTPDYCDGCLAEYRARMRAVGRCHPPKEAQCPTG